MKTNNLYYRYIIISTTIATLTLVLTFSVAIYSIVKNYSSYVDQQITSFHDYFLKDIRNDILQGSYYDVYHKCLNFSNDPLVIKVHISDSSQTICDLKKNNLSYLKKQSTVFFDENKLTPAASIIVHYKSKNVSDLLYENILYMAALFIALFILLYVVIRKTGSFLFSDILLLSNSLATNELSDLLKIKSILKNEPTKEVKTLLNSIESLALRLTESQAKVVSQSKTLAIAELAKHVAHDIRSPLSALNVASSNFINLPEAQRNLIKNAVQRINDIANDLLEKSKEPITSNVNPSENYKYESILELTNEVITEKKLQHFQRDNLNINVISSLNSNPTCCIRPSELKRILSNLINNSIEAVENKDGIIEVNLSEDDKFIKIHILDNGKGIPLNIIKNIGEKGFSFGKDNSQISGSGLGIYHAKSTLEAANGFITINSQIDHGTQITLGIPKSKP